MKSEAEIKSIFKQAFKELEQEGYFKELFNKLQKEKEMEERILRFSHDPRAPRPPEPPRAPTPKVHRPACPDCCCEFDCPHCHKCGDYKA